MAFFHRQDGTDTLDPDLVEMMPLSDQTVHVWIMSYGRALVKGKPCV